MIFNYLDSIYYINLDSDKHKVKYFSDQTNNTILNEVCTRFPAINGKYIDIRLIDNNIITEQARKDILLKSQKNYGISLTYGSLGCALSHRLLFNMVSSKRDPCLIFEDDIVVHNNFDSNFLKLITRLRNIDFDICYLGYNQIPGLNVEYIDNVISKPTGLITGLYAYILSVTGAHKLLDILFPLNKQIDSSISDNQYKLKLLCCSKPIIGVKTDFGSTTQMDNSCYNINTNNGQWDKLFS